MRRTQAMRFNRPPPVANVNGRIAHLRRAGRPIQCDDWPYRRTTWLESKSVVDELGIRTPAIGSALGDGWSDVLVGVSSTRSGWNLDLRSKGRNARLDAPAKRNIYLTASKFDGRHERLKRCARHDVQGRPAGVAFCSQPWHEARVDLKYAVRAAVVACIGCV